MKNFSVLLFGFSLFVSSCGSGALTDKIQNQQADFRKNTDTDTQELGQEPLSVPVLDNLTTQQKSKLLSLVEQKQYVEAIDYLKRELEESPNDNGVRVLLSAFYVLQEQADQALLILQKWSPDAAYYLEQLQNRFKNNLLEQDILDHLKASSGEAISGLFANLSVPQASVAKEAADKYGPLIKEWNLDPVQEFQEPANNAYQVKVVMALNADTQGLGDYIAQMVQREDYSPELQMPGQQVEQTLKGKLSLDDLGRDASDQRWLQMQWYDEGSSLKVPGYSDQERLEQAFQYGLNNELARGPFLLKLNANLRLETFYTPSQMSPDIVERFLFLAHTLMVKFTDGAFVQGPPRNGLKKNGMHQVNTKRSIAL